MTLQCPITVTVTAPTPTVTPCATYKSTRNPPVGANATYAQAAQATLDFQNGVIDQACSIAIVQSYQATLTVTPANITATNFSAGASTVRVGEINLTIIWKNTGGQPDTFIPRVYLNGVAQGLGEVARTLAPGDSYGNQYVITGLPAGDYTVCPMPN